MGGKHLSKISNRKGSFAIAVIVLIVVLVVAMAFVAVLFLPVKAVNFDESKSVPSTAGVNRLALRLNADAGEVRIIYTNLSGLALSMHVTAKGAVGLLQDPNSISLDFVQSTSGDNAIVNATLNVKDRLLGAANLNLRCDVMIDSSMRSSLNVSTGVGTVLVNSTNASALDQVTLSASTGAVTLKVASGVSLNGDITLSTNIGATILNWQNPAVDQDIKVVATAKTGGVELQVNQTTPMDRAVSLNGTTAVGGVSLNMGTAGNIGASIDSKAELGGVHVGSSTGFNGTDSALRSNNYPSTGNFGVNLTTKIGGVEVNALSVPSKA